MTNAKSFVEGKLVLVTGATDGIGKATALQLASLGARVIIHGRSSERAKAVREQIERETGNNKLGVAVADFSSLQEVRRLASELRTVHSELRVLINNAGIFSQRYALSHDGFEETFAINYLAPFLLTNLLVDRFMSNAPSRIVNVTSTLHRGASLNLNADEDTYDGHAAYGTSKLALALYSVELAERLRGRGVTVNCLHPGGVNTKLLRAGFGAYGISPESGAEVPVRVASGAEFEQITGKYFDRTGEARPDPRVEDKALRKELWDYTERVLSGVGVLYAA